MSEPTVQEIREAIEAIRGLVDDVFDQFPRPWSSAPEDDEGLFAVTYRGGSSTLALTPDYGQLRLPDYIASWTPEVASAIADWLTDEATQMERTIPEWREGIRDPRNRWAERGMTVESNIEHHYGRPLAVARAYLGRQS